MALLCLSWVRTGRSGASGLFRGGLGGGVAEFLGRNEGGLGKVSAPCVLKGFYVNTCSIACSYVLCQHPDTLLSNMRCIKTRLRVAAAGTTR